MSYYLNYAHEAVFSQLSSFSRTIILTALKQLAHGQLTVTTEDGEAGSKPETFVFGTGEPKAEITVKSKNVWTRLCVNLDLGSAEAYMLRELECSDPVKLIQIYTANWTALSGGSFLLQILPKLQRLLLKPTNDERVALENAKSHYDTSNTMFSLFLSSDMSYSCALWKTASEIKEGEAEESLGDAQLRKVHNIIDKARIRKEHHVLDIGGGWAFLAIEAVKKIGCKVTVSTLSVEQKALGEQRVKDEGLEDRIEIILCDYRKTPMPEGGYDRIVSVEMIEHVGKEFMDTYFSTINSLLNPTNGIMVTQGITLINQIHENPSPMDNFLDRYIFPGGYLPSIHRVLDSVNVGSKGALEIETVQSIGPHYVKTLRSWRENFLENWVAIREDFEKGRGGKELSEGEVEAWRRRWIYYFSYCEAAFRAGVIGDHVVVARRRPCVEEGLEIPM